MFANLSVNMPGAVECKLNNTGWSRRSLNLFYLALVLYLIPSSLLIWDGLPNTVCTVMSWMKNLSAFLCIVRIGLIGLEHPRYALTCFCLFILIFFSVWLVRDYRLMSDFLIVAASRSSNYRIIFRIYLCYLVLLFLINPIFYLAGLSWAYKKTLWGITVRTYGFGNTNTLAYAIVVLTFLGFCMSDTQYKPVRLFAVSWAVALVTFMLTLSRTSTIILLAFPVLCLIFERTKPSAKVAASIPVIALLLSVLMASVIAPGYGGNTFISRFSIPHLSYDFYGLSLLGHDYGREVLPQAALHGGFNVPFTVDNVYLLLLHIAEQHVGLDRFGHEIRAAQQLPKRTRPGALASWRVSTNCVELVLDVRPHSANHFLAHGSGYHTAGE